MDLDTLLGHYIPPSSGRPERIQTLAEHSRHVAELCSHTCQAIDLENLGYLCGLIHDFGKAKNEIQAHLRGENPQKLNHSAAGMRFLWERYATKSSNCRIAAQMAALAIGSHHSCRSNVLSTEGTPDWLERMDSAQAASGYQACVERFFSECCTVQELDERMEKAGEEIGRLKKNVIAQMGKDEVSDRYAFGMVQRFLFSALIDADWTDTACFANYCPLPKPAAPEQRQALWNSLGQNVEAYLGNVPPCHPIDALRAALSEQCKAAATGQPGIYRLFMPTGGGKTLSGLRYCLQTAIKSNAAHIFYFAPFKSILSQNYKVFVKALGRSDCILQHHSDVVLDKGDEELLAQMQNWQGAPFIATTMVQCLNTLFAAPRKNVRRLAALANSVLFFDEVQALPPQDIYLFNLSLNVLAGLFHCTVILCTATQPALEQVAYPVHLAAQQEIIQDYETSFLQFRRTAAVNKLVKGGYSAAALADFALARMKENKSCLMIFNTKKEVELVYDAVKAEQPTGLTVFYLTTCLCAQHRQEVIEAIKAWLDNPPPGEKLLCISSQLVEAGVDFSFDCVVRSIAGLDSIAQAAGRCNRHGEAGLRPVYIVNPAQEDLRYLPEIDMARQVVEELFRDLPPQTDLFSPATMTEYYRRYYEKLRANNTMAYPAILKECTPPCKVTLLDLFSSNPLGYSAYKESHPPLPSGWDFLQAFETAEKTFEAIPDETVSVLAPYKAGIAKISQLASLSAYEKPSPNLLQELQPYCVAISEAQRRNLAEQHAFLQLPCDSILALQADFYSDEKGVLAKPKPLPFTNL